VSERWAVQIQFIIYSTFNSETVNQACKTKWKFEQIKSNPTQLFSDPFKRGWVHFIQHQLSPLKPPSHWSNGSGLTPSPQYGLFHSPPIRGGQNYFSGHALIWSVWIFWVHVIFSCSKKGLKKQSPNFTLLCRTSKLPWTF